MKLRSYKKADFKCEDCEFIGESEYTMENIEWGICECKTKTLEYMKVHLAVCEVYRCASTDDPECECKVKT